jgi:glutathione peroxidase
MRRFTWMGLLMITSLALHAADPHARPLIGPVTSIDGKPVDLGIYTGKVVLAVNVASHCGFTKQYKQLQELYTHYQSRGFVVLGFPCNQFGAQEPGSEAEIKSFCEKEFAVSFPLFSKIDVNGAKAAPLYKYLTSNQAAIQDQGPVKWNFEKFLFNRNGELIGRFRSSVTPDATNVIAAIEGALGEKTPGPGQ